MLLILLPKSTLNANLTTTNRFFTNDDWLRGRFENFESDHQYESNLESDVRIEIESNIDIFLSVGIHVNRRAVLDVHFISLHSAYVHCFMVYARHNAAGFGVR